MLASRSVKILTGQYKDIGQVFILQALALQSPLCVARANP